MDRYYIFTYILFIYILFILFIDLLGKVYYDFFLLWIIGYGSIIGIYGILLIITMDWSLIHGA